MLTEKEYAKALAKIQERIQKVTDFYLGKVCDQLNKLGEFSPSSVDRLAELRKMRISVKEIERKLQEATALNKTDIKKLYQQAAESEYTNADFLYLMTGAEVDTTARTRMVNALYRQTAAEMDNYSNTTCITDDYRAAVDDGIQAVLMNQPDYKGAIRKTIKRIGGSGLRIQYESGVRRRLDTAVRMNIIDGVKHVQQKAQEMIGEEIGADGVELTAHPYSAPDHEPVQGRQFSLDEFTKMQSGVSFADVDGNHYTGFKRPIAEWNCRHFAMYIILGISKRIYSNEQLSKWQRTNATGFKLNGKHYTIYEASQKMREIETNIRRQKDIANAAKMMGDNQLRRQAQSTINSLQAEYDGFSKASGLAMRKDRAAVSEFKRVKTAAELKRNQLTNTLGKRIMKSNRRIGLQFFAEIPESKFLDYALDMEKQPDKARAFRDALGYTKENYKDLIENIRANVDEEALVFKASNRHGKLYEYVTPLKGPNGKSANVCTGWIIENGKTEPRLTSVYVTKKEATKRG